MVDRNNNDEIVE